MSAADQPQGAPAAVTPTAALAELHTPEGRFTVERARRDDVPAVVGLLRDDMLGASRELDDLGPYLAAFDRVDADSRELLAVVRDAEGAVVGCAQVTVLHGLSRGAATRVQVEGVRIGESGRSTGLGTTLFAWVEEYARQQGASLVQLTTDKQRSHAHRFYERLGYKATHEGMKLHL